MRVRMQMYGDVESVEVALEGARKAADEKTLYEALMLGGGIVQDSVQRQVRTKARQHPRGQLEDSISVEKTRVGGTAVTVGWDATPIQNKIGRRSGLRSSREVRAGYTDVSGAYHKVNTVADYARILEYSEKRQLRHMEVGEEEVHDQTERAIAEYIDEAIARGLK